MATLASRTKLLSGLPSGTLAQHLAAITLGKGERLVSQFFVSLQTPEIHVTHKAKREAARPAPEPSVRRSEKVKKNIYAITSIPRIYVKQSPDEIYLVQKTHAVQVGSRMETVVVRGKK